MLQLRLKPLGGGDADAAGTGGVRGEGDAEGVRASANLLLSKRSCFRVVLRFSASMRAANNPQVCVCACVRVYPCARARLFVYL